MDSFCLGGNDDFTLRNVEFEVSMEESGGHVKKAVHYKAKAQRRRQDWKYCEYY